MNKFELIAKPARIALGFAVAVGVGLAAVLVTYGLIDRFSNWTATRVLPIALGIGAVVAVGMVLSTLFGTIRRIELDDQALRIHMLAGGTKEYRLGENRFSPKLTHQMNRGQHVGTTRAIEIVGPHGTDTHTINFEPAEFNELVNRLTGQPMGAPAAPAQATGAPGVPGTPVGAVGRQPLNFQPQRFEISTRPLRKFSVMMYALAVVVFLLGALAAWGISTEEDTEPYVVWALLGSFILFALFCLLPVVMMRRRAARLPKQIVVAPTWVAFDDRAFNYADLKVIQIKPPGAPINRSAKILTRADERVVYELGIGAHHKMFENYDEFAHLLERAGTAAAGVVRIDWS